MPHTKKHEVHILLGCADARDLSQIHVDAVRHITAEWRQRGIDVDYHTIRAAGSFVTPDVVMDIKRTIEQELRASQDVKRPVSFYVHVQSHGHLTDDSSKEYISHVHDLHIVDGSPLNCGMLKASSLGIELEQLILEEQPEVMWKGEKHVINDDKMIRRLLRYVYNHDGYLAGDWIKSIDLLRTHPRNQRTELERAIKSDPELKTLDIKVTAGIQDYSIHSLIRVDGGEPEAPWWDEVQAYIREQVKHERAKSDVLLKQAELQKPLAGLLCMSDPRMSSRLNAAQYYLALKGIEHGAEYMPNTVFNISGSNFDIPLTPFGPYVIAGFYFSIHYLGLTDQMVMGYDPQQTERILAKVENDPIMNLIVKKYKVNLIPVNQIDSIQQ
ncbi:MAG TPA: hypothetical protein VL651_00445 [Bacteroidia bacterium]|jgi:hypothetical protein|nr:hypothetical protein [Bacteroidia bacterium]